ncbi:Hypothetical protein LUCI_3151 [Lucifera butyrica]|uniref:bis(5'-nucleosyl)-tetraphosphatase (symmetrical) n=1 Tax=Lucifera butyrica TaxID=1351585 RepID=A0A498R595_9FIRM|nr:bis(5'-nucleosyl)-tetraphosphatase (symmetrical) YqeK [Lucifera butyrica]VBB07886.1 Hypothetical protein LUCI_3151 [Lucifera butyrica]
MNYDEMVDKLSRILSPSRFRHSLGVSRSAVELAERFGADINKARVAGILHDCARELPGETLLQMAEKFGIVVNDVESHSPSLLHAPVGARLAQEQYGIHDIAILQAITLHTVGGPVMTVLDQIVYLADFIEPGRVFPGVDQLRLLAGKNLREAVLAGYDQTLNYLVARRGLIHPATVEGRNALLV